MKIRPVRVELFHAEGATDRQTDTPDEANYCFSQFCKKRLASVNTLRTGIFFLYINHKSLIQSKVTCF
jgi:hypothetical protein